MSEESQSLQKIIEEVKASKHQKVKLAIVDIDGVLRGKYINKQKFLNYKDMEDRAGLKDPVNHLAKRILEEITGETQFRLFVKRWTSEKSMGNIF